MRKVAREVNNVIAGWSQSKNKLVVAIDGYTGIGKTTLLNNLAAVNPNILAVNRDDFLIPRTKLKKLIKKSKDHSKVFELEVNDNARLRDLIRIFRKSHKHYRTKIYNPINGKIDIPKEFDLSKKIMVIEGVFMFHPRLLNDLWDRRVYLKGNVEKIDKRRVAREKRRWGKDYFSESHPDSYFKQVIIALKRYQMLYHPEKVADLVIQI